MSQPGSPQAVGSGPEAMLASLLLQLPGRDCSNYARRIEAVG